MLSTGVSAEACWLTCWLACWLALLTWLAWLVWLIWLGASEDRRRWARASTPRSPLRGCRRRGSSSSSRGSGRGGGGANTATTATSEYGAAGHCGIMKCGGLNCGGLNWHGPVPDEKVDVYRPSGEGVRMRDQAAGLPSASSQWPRGVTTAEPPVDHWRAKPLMFVMFSNCASSDVSDEAVLVVSWATEQVSASMGAPKSDMSDHIAGWAPPALSKRSPSTSALPKTVAQSPAELGAL
mmetsp:Transcript_22374/g.59066  ORF Transcript_22374/g.59066 Transcript_22374/m.59066 type:complete len:238 (+) Transcript_22374:433-1146(+)